MYGNAVKFQKADVHLIRWIFTNTSTPLLILCLWSEFKALNFNNLFLTMWLRSEAPQRYTFEIPYIWNYLHDIWHLYAKNWLLRCMGKGSGLGIRRLGWCWRQRSIVDRHPHCCQTAYSWILAPPCKLCNLEHITEAFFISVSLPIKLEYSSINLTRMKPFR